MQTQQLGLTPEQQARIVAAARSWLGTPFHHGACRKGPDGGVDCGQLLIAIYLEAGVLQAAPQYESFPPHWHLHESSEHYLRLIAAYCQRVQQPWQPGDILVFRGPRWPSAGHAGIYLGDGMLIHAIRGAGVQIWPVRSTLLAASLDSAWRWAHREDRA